MENTEPKLRERWVGKTPHHPWEVEINRVQEARIGFKVVGHCGGKSRHRMLTMKREQFIRDYRRKR